MKTLIEKIITILVFIFILFTIGFLYLNIKITEINKDDECNYIASVNSQKKYYYEANHSSVERIKDNNKLCFSSHSEASLNGFQEYK